MSRDQLVYVARADGKYEVVSPRERAGVFRLAELRTLLAELPQGTRVTRLFERATDEARREKSR